MCLAVVYLVGMNVFLSTSLFEKAINREPDVIDIHFRRGWSVFPGRIHAQGLSIRGKDSNVEWILKLDETDFDVSLFLLRLQQFSVSRVHGRGITFRIRQRLDAEPKSPDEVKNLPPIDGFAAYSVRPPKKPSPETWDDKAYHLWSARLERITAEDVREVWIDNGRFEGSADIRGRFYLKPIRNAEVGPAHIDVHRGAVFLGPVALVDSLDGGRIDATMSAFDPRTTDGPAMIHHVTLATEMHLGIPDLASLPFTLLDDAHVAGRLEFSRLALRVDAGVLKADTHVLASAPTVRLTRDADIVTTSLEVTADVAPVAGADTLTFRVGVRGLEASRRGEGHAARPPVVDGDGGHTVLLRVPRADVSGDGRALDLTRPLTDLHVVLDLFDGVIPDLARTTALLAKDTPVTVFRGRAAAEGHLEAWLADHRAAGHAAVHLADVDAQTSELRGRTAADIEASVGAFAWDGRVLENAHVALDLRDVAIAEARTPAITAGRAERVHAEAAAARLDLDDPLAHLEAKLSIPKGEVRGESLVGLLPTDMALLGHPTFALTVDGAVANHVARATADVHAARLGVTRRLVTITADVDAHAQVHDWKLDEGSLVVDGADVSIDRLAVTRRDASADSEPAATIRRFTVGATPGVFSTRDPLARIGGLARLDGGRVNDVAVLNGLLPVESDVRFASHGGELTMEARLEVLRHVAQGKCALKTKSVGVGSRAVSIEGDIDVEAVVAGYELARGHVAMVDGRVAVTSIDGRVVGNDAPVMHADRVAVMAHAEDLELGAEEADASESSSPPAARPLGRAFEGRVVVTNATIPEARELQTLVEKGSVFGIESGAAKVEADVTLSSAAKSGNGRINVELKKAAVRLNETGFAGDFIVLGQVRGFDPAKWVLDVAGSRVAMRDVEVVGSSTDTERWHGDMVLQQATLRLDDAPELVADITLEARDASPLLAILLRDKLPKIFAGLTRMPHLGAATQLTLGAHRMALRDLVAQGGDIAVRGVYGVQGEHKRGAFIVEKGPFSAGLKIGDDGVGVRLFGLNDWLHAQSADVGRLLDRPVRAKEAPPGATTTAPSVPAD